MKKIILLAIVTFFLVAPFTYHPDTKLTLRYPALESGKVWDIYGYLDSHPLDIPDFHYPPAHFWWLKIHYPISKILGGDGFDEWMSSGSVNASFDANAFKYNLAAKFPLLILGIISGWLIYLIVKKASGDEKKSILAALIWYFNPVTLYSVVIMGQNDIVAICLFLAGILFIKNWWITLLFWGLASGVKSYPLIWSVMFLLAWEKNILKLVAKVASLALIYFLIISFWLSKSYFVEAVLNSGLSQRMFISNIPLGFDKQILVVPFLLAVVALNTWKSKVKNIILKSSTAIFQSCLVILGFSHFNPQWMLWTVPFLAIWWSLSGIKKTYLIALLAIVGAWVGLTLSFDDRFLSWGLFTPINPYLINFPSLPEYVKNKGSSIEEIVNICQSVLAGVSIWFLMQKIKIKKLSVKGIKISKWFVVVPWIVTVVIIFVFNTVKTENVLYPQKSGNEISLNEARGKKWFYNINDRIKYLEISLNNPGLNSQDKAVLVVSNSKGEVFEKEFSGFNAGANSWLRMDIPATMSDDILLSLEIKNVEVKDGLLKIYLDTKQNWAINIHTYTEMSMGGLFGRILAFWWWWVIVGAFSGAYLYSREN